MLIGLKIERFFGGILITNLINTEWLFEDPRKMMVTLSNTYIDPHGVSWHVSVGDIIDGSSIPRILWLFEGSPFVGLHRTASVFHDVACQRKDMPWQKVHQMYDDCMKFCGVSNFSRKKKSLAVKRFGPRW